MEVKVHFRFNKATGEVEIFEVEDVGGMRLPEAEHNREHDRISAELGSLLERNPRVDEIFPGSIQTTVQPSRQPEEDDETVTPHTDEQKRREPE